MSGRRAVVVILGVVAVLAVAAVVAVRIGQRPPVETVGPIVFDTVPGAGPVVQIGSSARLVTSSTPVKVAVRLSTEDARLVDAAVIRVRETESGKSYDAVAEDDSWLTPQTRLLSGERTFPEGTYEFFFTYLADGRWHDDQRRRTFVVVNDRFKPPPVPEDPVAPGERNANDLKSIGADARWAYEGQPVRLAARLDADRPLKVDAYGFAIRDRNGRAWDNLNTDVKEPLNADASLGGTGGELPPGNYTYWFTYRADGRWHALGDPRTLRVFRPPNVAAPPGRGWQKIPEASDEFDRFDSARWDRSTAHSYPVSCREDVPILAFEPRNVSVRAGHLRIAARAERTIVTRATCGGASKTEVDHTGGFVESRFDIPGEPSYVEVRAKPLNSRANVLSAIWLQTFPLTIDQNPNPEIDVLETFDFSRLWSTLHSWSCMTDDCAKSDHLVHGRQGSTGAFADSSARFHTYGLERRDGWLRFYVDGTPRWQRRIAPGEEAFSTQPRHLILSIEGHLGEPDDAHLPGAFEIDYVRTYRYTAD